MFAIKTFILKKHETNKTSTKLKIFYIQLTIMNFDFFGFSFVIAFKTVFNFLKNPI